MRIRLLALPLMLVLGAPACRPAATAVDLSPSQWPAGEYDQFIRAQGVDRTSAGAASGSNGAVTVAYNGLAARAGLEALKQGGNAIDAAMTAAVTQVALTAGAPISYFGIMSLVYYEASSGKVYTMNAEWNTVRGETSPGTIPGSLNMSSLEGLRGTAASGRTALVGGFMKGVGAAHDRFGRLPFAHLFEPAIEIAEGGMPVTSHLADKFEFRHEDLSRLPETRALFIKDDGSDYVTGDTFTQPALAETLRAVALQGTDYMYKGPWAKKLVAAIAADGGKMTEADLASYDVIWDEPLVATVGDYEIYTNRPPNAGGPSLIEAQLLAEAAGLAGDAAPSQSAATLRKLLDISMVGLLPPATIAQLFPDLDPSADARLTPARAAALWKRIEAGGLPMRWKSPSSPGHSDDVVAIDSDGNIAAITQSINCVDWGRTAINIDGISIGDPASFQQAAIAALPPGSRLPAPTETGILLKDGTAVLGFASMGSGLHIRTLQALLGVIGFGMTVEEAVNAPDLLMPTVDSAGQWVARVPEGRFEKSVLDAIGYAYQEIPASRMRFGGEGLWVGISRDPVTGLLRAASHNRNNSAAVAW
ncbi:MAG: gamma-glutamyltransferase [Acidobacteria bacterium]|nr:gamma-glutamyltransferase [Acidobacteriota bacterium]